MTHSSRAFERSDGAASVIVLLLLSLLDGHFVGDLCMSRGWHPVQEVLKHINILLDKASLSHSWLLSSRCSMSTSSADQGGTSRSYAAYPTRPHGGPRLRGRRFWMLLSWAWVSVSLEFFVIGLIALLPMQLRNTVSWTILEVSADFVLVGSDHGSLALSMIIHVEELLVDFADLCLIKTESFSVRQRFDSGKLIKQNEVVIKNAVVNSI